MINDSFLDEQGFNKIWPSEDTKAIVKERLKNMKVQFGTMATTDQDARGFYSIDRIVIHPDYFQVWVFAFVEYYCATWLDTW